MQYKFAVTFDTLSRHSRTKHSVTCPHLIQVQWFFFNLICVCILSLVILAGRRAVKVSALRSHPYMYKRVDIPKDVVWFYIVAMKGGRCIVCSRLAGDLNRVLL